MKPATILLLLILAAAGFLRFWQLDEMPPGWRDDELINSLVISQHAIDGEWRLYYPDASGHEGLYHLLNALPLYLFGPGAAGIRLLSALMGTAVVWFTYLLAGEMYGRRDIALAAAAALAVSFWGLMYARIGLRHISLIFFVTPAFYLLWRGLNARTAAGATAGRRSFLLAALLLGLAFYTYFASRGVPLILLAWLAALLLFNRPSLARLWSGVWLTTLLAGALAVPLFLTLQSQPEAEARVAELAVPIVAAREGDFGPLLTFTWRTLNMFHADGDDEFLYNIPGRPVFGPLGGVFFWLGVGLAAVWGWKGRRSRGAGEQGAGQKGAGKELRWEAGAFLLLWWLAGIAPAFLSVPPASLSHTILAQPAVYILAALPVGWGADRLADRLGWLSRSGMAAGLGLLLVGGIAARDLPDYFVTWPARGNTRFLYRADIHDVARKLRQAAGPVDVGLAGLLAGPWDRLAFEANLGAAQERVDARWFDPRRALLLEPSRSWIGYPRGNDPFAPDLYIETGRLAGEYREAIAAPAVVPVFGETTCFTNGLCLAVHLPPDQTGQTVIVDVLVTVDAPLALPDSPLVSNPPPPGVYAGPRLQIFAHLRDDHGRNLAVDDALGVDPLTLEVGDKFWQRHRLRPDGRENPVTIAVGLYDPRTGGRIRTTAGESEIIISPGPP